MEYVAIADLLRRGFDVFIPLVDDQGIDVVVRGAEGETPVYADIQIKARSREVKQPATFSAMSIPDPRPHYYWIFWSAGAQTFWIFPSEDLVREATQNKTGQNAGRYSIVLANVLKDGTVKPRPRFSSWEGEAGFKLLANAVKPFA